MSLEEIQGTIIVLKLSENIEPMLFISNKSIAILQIQNEERKTRLHVKHNVIQAADHYCFHESISSLLIYGIAYNSVSSPPPSPTPEQQ